MTTITLEETLNSGNMQNGRVKWFNNKAGYGFITFQNNENSELDVFVHHSSIKVENHQYKYLVQGEYVDFKLVSVKDDKHQFQASEVSGINSGKLMCETRREYRIARSNYKTPEQEPPSDHPIESLLKETIKIPKQSRPNRVRGEGPRDSQMNDWTEVKKSRKVPSKVGNKSLISQQK